MDLEIVTVDASHSPGEVSHGGQRIVGADQPVVSLHDAKAEVRTGQVNVEHAELLGAKCCLQHLPGQYYSHGHQRRQGIIIEREQLFSRDVTQPGEVVQPV